jgi:hypothetical protein
MFSSLSSAIGPTPSASAVFVKLPARALSSGTLQQSSDIGPGKQLAVSPQHLASHGHHGECNRDGGRWH